VDERAIICLAIHPGAVDTFTSRSSFTAMFVWVFSCLVFMPREVGAHNPCFGAAAPEIKQNSKKWKGAYVEPVGQITEPSPAGKNMALAKEL
jgi:hypothetical protein